MQFNQEELFINDLAYRVALFKKLPHRVLCVLACEFAHRALAYFVSVDSSTDLIELVVAGRKSIDAVVVWVIDPTQENHFAALTAVTAIDGTVERLRRMSDQIFDLPEGILDAFRSVQFAAMTAESVENADSYAESAATSAIIGSALYLSRADRSAAAGLAARVAQARWSLAAYRGAANRFDWDSWIDQDVLGRGWWNNAWSNGDVIAIAKSIFAERAFDRMPILADALEEADCDNVQLLKHLRNPESVFTRADCALLGPMIYRDLADASRRLEKTAAAVNLEDRPAVDDFDSLTYRPKTPPDLADRIFAYFSLAFIGCSILLMVSLMIGAIVFVVKAYLK